MYTLSPSAFNKLIRNAPLACTWVLALPGSAALPVGWLGRDTCAAEADSDLLVATTTLAVLATL